MKNFRNFSKKKKAILIIIVVLCVPSSLFSCNSRVEVTSRCIPASELQIAAIQDGVDDIVQNNYIKTAWAVKSETFENVWMVAAKIYGPGMENGTGPGVWATLGDFDSPGMCLSVDRYAKELSIYPDASKTDAAITLADDGVSEAIECAENE